MSRHGAFDEVFRWVEIDDAGDRKALWQSTGNCEGRQDNNGFPSDMHAEVILAFDATNAFGMLADYGFSQAVKLIVFFDVFEVFSRPPFFDVFDVFFCVFHVFVFTRL